MPGSTRLKRKIRASLRGVRISVPVQLAAAEALELGDIAEDQGISTGELIHQLTRLAWEAITERPLGTRYDLSPDVAEPSRLMPEYQRRIQAAAKGKEFYGYRPQASAPDMSQEEAAQEPGQGCGSDACDPKDQSD